MTASKRTRTTVASVAVAGALIGGTLVVPQLAIASNNTITATTAVNVRIEPTISSEILGTLTAGEQVERRGDPLGGRLRRRAPRPPLLGRDDRGLPRPVRGGRSDRQARVRVGGAASRVVDAA